MKITRAHVKIPYKKLTIRVVMIMILGDFITADQFIEEMDLVDPCASIEDAVTELAAMYKRINEKSGHLYIHPTARVSPKAHIGNNVIIGPGSVVHEFSSLRRCVLSCDVEVGFGCEIADSVILSGTGLSHRININSSILGQNVHMGANAATACVSIYNEDLKAPTRPIEIRLHNDNGGFKVSTAPKFGAILGDSVRVGAAAVVGPGVVVGRRSIICAGVIIAGLEVTSDRVIKNVYTQITESLRVRT